MAASVVWLDQAKDDIHALIDYLFPKNPTAALAYVADLEDASNGLADYPLRGDKMTIAIGQSLCATI